MENTKLIYLTPNLKLYKEEIEFTPISDAEVSRAGFLIKYPMELSIKYKGVWKSYYIIDRKMVNKVEVLFSNQCSLPEPMGLWPVMIS